MRTKKTKRDLNRLRAQAAAPLEWCERPGWFLGPGDPSILTTVGPNGDDIRLAAGVGREEYLEAVATAVEAGEFPKQYRDPDQAEMSWLRFLLFRDHGEHGGHCLCGPCVAKRPPAPPPQPTAPAGESYLNEGGSTNRRSSRETPEPDDRYLAEEQRLLRIRNSVETRWFTS